MERGHHALSPDAFEAVVNETGALVLDVRDAEEFAKGFVPNSINIGLHGQFAPWVGALIPDLKQPIALVTPVGLEEETVLRLARVGYDHSIGYLDGGFASWAKSGKDVDSVESVSAEEFVQQYGNGTVVDVRRPDEFAVEHIKNAENFPLDNLNDHMAEIDKNEPVYIHCAGGYRSMVAASILKARGFDNLINVEGGMAAIKKTGQVPAESTHGL
jgi:hydroxyacylglutathione hydrolase